MTDPRTPFNVDPDEPPTEAELREAQAFADHLASGADGELEALARGIAFTANAEEARIAVSAKRAVDQAVNRREAGARAESGRLLTFRRAAAAASGVLALAAAALFFVRAHPDAPETSLIAARSTQPLFSQPFSQEPASARIDRIALARMGDLRENRFRLAMTSPKRRRP